MNVLIDMNLSPEWCKILETPGLEIRHWSTIGPPDATDSQIIGWARTNRYVLLTQDLDIPQLLFATKAGQPSVVLLRINDELSPSQQARVRTAMLQSVKLLETGCLMVFDDARLRVRPLPIEPE